ncbi:HAD-IIIA family hydrolase [Parabacteroides sp. PF5-9]|uniref:D-glycero-alpha-D-manno-heptose-1,7-bisphosphate 7-phosphatase n=1 Tax=Parabacteroides sp. PF5-9 TaxID=1742404 RepID=UPI002475C0A9|nr:HAD-IIIA family hydrolase [Parabacteroides sp. PF5-9]MDH6358712.1 D-glycero-D-manno-heptose 1,7-bisphosphate phosphatase [Parabacteroides sp. PF5-9]
MEDTKRYNTLFLDRDGVINVHLPGDYVKTVDEFVFVEGALEAIKRCSFLFEYIIVVTNQRGVGKGIMTDQALCQIHEFMLCEIHKYGGRIDRIYVSTALNDEAPDRKPNPGMGLRAKHDFPNIDFSESWMAGDSLSDMQFANRLGIKAVLIGNKAIPEINTPPLIYARYPDLFTFAAELNTN